MPARAFLLFTCTMILAQGAAFAGGDVLVWATGNAANDTAGVRDYIAAAGDFDSVTAVDQNETFALGDLLAYEALLYFSEQSQDQDPVAIGDVLADYADTGRTLVLATFSWANQGSNTLAGRIVTDAISPVVAVSDELYTTVTMDWNDGSALFDGVTAITSYFHCDVGLTAGASERARWNDGRPMVATKGNVVAITIYPDETYGGAEGDYVNLFVNALAAIFADGFESGDTLAWSATSPP